MDGLRRSRPLLQPAQSLAGRPITLAGTPPQEPIEPAAVLATTNIVVPRRNLKPYILTAAFSAAVLSVTPIYNYLQQPNVAFDQLVVKTINIVHPQPIVTVEWAKIDSSLPALINSSSGLKIGVSVIDLSTGKQSSYGETGAFTGASTTKVVTAIAFLQMVEQGKVSLSEKLGSSPADYQLRQMIQRSNNDSWALLNARVGTASLQKLAPSYGANSYKYIGNKISAADDATMLARLYQGKLLNADHTQLLLSYMQNTNNEQLIAGSDLPSGATVYHKYGQLDENLHDTSIIKIDGRPLILSIYTAGSGDYTTRTNLIHQITDLVIAK